jgi:hypothetical protein
MQTNIMLRILIAGTALLAVSPFAVAQTPETKESLEKKLKAKYPLTKLSADGKDVVTAGSVFTLKKDGLVLTPTDANDVSGNSYKDGKIVQGKAGKANEKVNKATGWLKKLPVPGAGSAPAAPTNATRTFVEGEKVNITRIEAKDGAVVFDVCSTKAYADVYYRGSLTFPVEKGTVPAADRMLATTGEIFSVDPTEDTKTTSASASDPPQQSQGAQTGQQAAGQAQDAQQAVPPPVTQQDAQPTKFADIAPPPPPPAAQPKLELGQTVDQVTAQLGQPVNTVVAGDKQIYLFKEWKVTFVKGKVTDIDVR